MEMLKFTGYYAEIPIEVSQVKRIPSDYYGLIGCPITILDKLGCVKESPFELLDMIEPSINGKALYKRYILRRRLPKEIAEYLQLGGVHYRIEDDLCIPIYDEKANE